MTTDERERRRQAVKDARENWTYWLKRKRVFEETRAQWDETDLRNFTEIVVTREAEARRLYHAALAANFKAA